MRLLEKPAGMGLLFASISASMIGLAWYNQKDKNMSESRFNHFINRQSQTISKDKIILALDPLNLFIHFSQVKIEGFKILQEKSRNLASAMLQRFKKTTHCYKEKVSARCIRHFIKKMKEIPGVELVIYTKLDEHYWIEYLLPKERRYFMRGHHKSAEEIDCDTGRVVIITANQEDQKDEIMSSHHNLIISHQHDDIDDHLLLKLHQCIQKLARMGRSDGLHEEMHHLALEMGIPLYNYQSSIQ